MKRNYLYITFVLIGILIGFDACKKESEPKNPFDDVKDEVEKDTVILEPTSFLALHNTIFSPICANSGCHDGNFEPDFRTVESSYNTMVNQAAIKTDFAKKWITRVVPNDSANSILIKRLTIDLNGNSGLMPFDVAQSTGWDKMKVEGIKNIGAWIMSGAKDMFGNSPSGTDFVPSLSGFQAISNVGDTLRHQGKWGAFQVKSGSSITLWFALKDDKTSLDKLTDVKIEISDKANIFGTGKVYNAQYVASPLVAKGMFNVNEKHYHKVTIPVSDLITEITWFRVSVNDGVNGPQMLPNENSLFYFKTYSSFKILP